MPYSGEILLEVHLQRVGPSGGGAQYLESIAVELSAAAAYQRRYQIVGVVWAAEGKFERDAFADVKRALPACSFKTQSSFILLRAQRQGRKH